MYGRNVQAHKWIGAKTRHTANFWKPAWTPGQRPKKRMCPGKPGHMVTLGAAIAQQRFSLNILLPPLKTWSGLLPLGWQLLRDCTAAFSHQAKNLQNLTVQVITSIRPIMDRRDHAPILQTEFSKARHHHQQPRKQAGVERMWRRDQQLQCIDQRLLNTRYLLLAHCRNPIWTDDTVKQGNRKQQTSPLVPHSYELKHNQSKPELINF